MKILNERPISMELNEYHAKQKEFKTWLKNRKQGILVYLSVFEKRKNGITIGVQRYPPFIGRVKELKAWKN